jgi:hypothetical protein
MVSRCGRGLMDKENTMSKYVDNTLVSDAEYTHIQAVKAAAATRQAAEVPGASQKTVVPLPPRTSGLWSHRPG